MKNEKMNDEGREFINSVHWLKENNRPGYFALASVVYANRESGMDGFPEVEAMFRAATKGELKRAIRYLREFQNAGKYANQVDNIISYIRRKWLHKEVCV